MEAGNGIAWDSDLVVTGRHVGDIDRGPAPKRAARGRVCAVETCSTRLDPYNLTDVCWIHRHHEAHEG